jgi:phenylacetate-CoA ligase
MALGRETDLNDQLQWLQEQRPEYLVTYPSHLESLVYANQGAPVDSLKCLRVISAMLTEEMRQRIENTCGLKVLQNYGLNELGFVATRCSAGRYHINSEAFIVEVVDDEGRACQPGEIGRVLVTALQNPFMPLIRYDTGDLAVAVAQDCLCGKTLPAIGRIIGRFRSMRHTPAGTPERLKYIEEVLEQLPLESLKSVRERQLHQYRDGSFTLRLAINAPVPEIVVQTIQGGWNQNFANTTLTITFLEKLDRKPNEKQQEFTSEFFPQVT